ncbi:hypothetical protein [Cryptosporangium sp. NPDC051539]
MDPVAPFAIAVMTLAGGALALSWAADKARRAARPVRVRAQRRRPTGRG